MSAVLHNIGVFFGHLAAVGWTSLGLALCCQFVKLACVSRAWRNIIDSSYPEAHVPWRTVWGAVLARVGINAIVPARGGDIAGLFLIKRRVDGATFSTLATTLVALTLFDSVAASCFIVYALATGELPGRTVLSRLPGFDFRWLFEHFRGTLIALGLVLLLLLILLLWFAEQLFEFRRRIARGFVVFGDKTRYLRRVAVWQVGDWLLRLATIFFFLRAFHVPGTLHNAILVQVTQSLAVLFPISPSEISTEQALLLYSFSGAASRTTLLSFSVGMRVTLIVFNAAVGFAALFAMLGTLRWRQRVGADPEAVGER
ncbi:MAG TPA: lysylphosphatidylglycerol synthase domain-containing protein [Gaiellaceae bacterium]|nr:lysylphosphatidylglycerol synthase domain-containing protein [Gaiellaceae bacterium]